MNKSVSLEKMKNDENKEFIALIKEIKNEEEHVEIEGGSDSEGSEDDLSQEESSTLFRQIMQRNNQSSYNYKRIKKTKNLKPLNKRP